MIKTDFADTEKKLVVTIEKREGGGISYGDRRLRSTNYYLQNKLQGHIVQHREYSQYFIKAINGV